MRALSPLFGRPLKNEQTSHRSSRDLNDRPVFSEAPCAGGLLFKSGQPGVDPATGLAHGEFAVQARQVFVNLETVLRAGGSRLDLVVNTTVLITDLANFPIVNRLFAEFFPNDPPARMHHASAAAASPTDFDRLCGGSL